MPDDTIASLRAAVGIAQDLQAIAEEKLRSFRTQVRDEAIRVKDYMGWCDEGLNETLESLGLEPVRRDHTVVVKVTLTVVAGNEDEIHGSDLDYQIRTALEGIGLNINEVELDEVYPD